MEQLALLERLGAGAAQLPGPHEHVSVLFAGEDFAAQVAAVVRPSVGADRRPFRYSLP
ncbi:hypothetical protein ACFWY5_34725 [Nonomuraea sp. NPDC059007]|uniref:hypothetical protein n=1 Tax=Nonomuraea sp. NPDC059007 TaxID=3346692 RepID=UPI0036854C9F